MALRDIIGQGVATAGQVLGLPEYGYSERISGSQQQTQPWVYGNRGGAYIDPTYNPAGSQPGQVFPTQSYDTTTPQTYPGGSTPTYNVPAPTGDTGGGATTQDAYSDWLDQAYESLYNDISSQEATLSQTRT